MEKEAIDLVQWKAYGDFLHAPRPIALKNLASAETRRHGLSERAPLKEMIGQSPLELSLQLLLLLRTTR